MSSLNIHEEITTEATGLEEFQEHEAKKSLHRLRRDSREREKQKAELREAKKDRGGKRNRRGWDDEDYE